MAGLTPFQTVGPYLHLGLHYGREPMAGRVARAGDRDCRPSRSTAPAPGSPTASSSSGRRASPPSGRAWTDPDGGYRLTATRPAGRRDPDGTVHAPHFAVRVLARGILTEYLTRVYFDGHPDNGADAVLQQVPAPRRATLIAGRRRRRRVSFRRHRAGRRRDRVLRPLTIAPAPEPRPMSPRPEPFTRAGHVQALLDVEVALAEALAAAAVIPPTCVPPIRIAAELSRYDLDSLAAEAAVAGNVLIPLVRHLTREVAAQDRDGGRFRALGRDQPGRDRHGRGRCSSGRRWRPSIARSIGRRRRPRDSRARHAATPIAGRTWLQQASPTTFGAKAASWLDGMERCAPGSPPRPATASDLQLGGATGTLASLGAAGPAVSRGAGHEPRLARRRHPLAHRAQPLRRRRLRAGPGVRNAGQDRPRPGAAGADRSRRGRRRGDGRPRRLVGDAAQAQSGRRRAGGGRLGARAGPGRDDAGGDAAGARARGGRLAGRVGDAAGAGRADRRCRRRHRRDVGASGRGRGADAGQPRRRRRRGAGRRPGHRPGAAARPGRRDAPGRSGEPPRRDRRHVAGRRPPRPTRRCASISTPRRSPAPSIPRPCRRRPAPSSRRC